MREDLINRITAYLANGGLFNPEYMTHAEVSKLLIDIRDYLKSNQVMDIPITPLPYPAPNTQPMWYGNCPKCGLKLDQVMGYVCSNPECPTGLGGTKCL
jgi:hypothetical protein